MPVKAQLDGHQLDLKCLAELFPDGDIKVVKTEEGFFLEAIALDGLFPELGRMQDKATTMLKRLNGVARLQNADFRPIRLLDCYVNDYPGSRHIAIGVTDEAPARDTAIVAMNGVIAESEAAGPRDLDLASSNPNVDELLALFGSADELSWNKLYKAYEIIRDDIGSGQKGLIATEWVTKDELSTFTGTANNPAASGAEARHARQSGPAPTMVMTIDEGRRFIRDLANRCLDSLR